MYKKRPGTSAISGQLYETKLLSLILFRLLHDDRFEDFYLASNLDEIGSFNDICFKAKIKGADRSVLVFIQVKHKEDCNSFIDFDEAKHFNDSYSKIVKKFYSKSNGKIFGSKFNEHECVFILYTNGKYNHDSGINVDSACASFLNDLLATGKGGTHLQCANKIVEKCAESILQEEIKILSDRFVQFLNANQSLQIMFDDHMLRYHVILAKSVVNISEIQSEVEKSNAEWRILTFRQDFFDTNDRYLVILRKAIFKRMLENQINAKDNYVPGEDSKVEEQLKYFLETPCASTLSPLIGTYVVYKKGKLEFISNEIRRKLQQPQQNYLSVIIEEAEEITARNILLSLELRVPVTFGNLDLMLPDRELDDLTKNIVNLCKTFKLFNYYKIVVIDETVEEKLLCVDGGLFGAVGNLLIYDKDTKLLKFADDCTSQQRNAGAILKKLKNCVVDLHKYRFDVKAKLLFSKLTFDCSEIANKLFHKPIIYAEQGDQNTVENILKREIEYFHNKNNLQSIQIRPESIFQTYHSEVQAWWLLKNKGPYLTKTTKLYQQVSDNILIEPLLSSLKNTFNMTKMKNITFTKESLDSLQRLSKRKDSKENLLFVNETVIVTDSITLTVIKLIQYLRITGLKNYTILDLECVIKLTTDDFCKLKAELRKTDKVVIIVVYENMRSDKTWYEKYLREITKVTGKHQKIVIIHTSFAEITEKAILFDVKKTENKSESDTAVIHETHSLVDFVPKSQGIVKKKGKIKFQGQTTNLDLLLDETSVSYVKGAVLNKIIDNEIIEIGDSLSNSNYEEIRVLYQDRSVEYVKSYLIPGNICVSSVNTVLDESAACHGSNVQEGQLGNSIFFIKILEDHNNRSCNSYSNDCSKKPDNINFYFTCRLCSELVNDSKKSVEMLSVENGRNVRPNVTCRLLIKKHDIINKTWNGNITLFDYSKQYKKWNEDKNVVKDILKTLRYMCQGAVLNHIIRNENVSIRKAMGDLNKETMEYLFNGEPLSNSNTCNESQSHSGRPGTSNHVHENTDDNISASKNQTSPSDTSTEIPAGYIISNDIDKFSYMYVQNYFSEIPEIFISSAQSKRESDMIPHKRQDDNADTKHKHSHNFQVCFYCNYRIDLKTFDDIKDNVVLLTSKAGMGKSTLLTHLSQKDFRGNMWVVRINLLSCSGQFNKWQQDKSYVIDILKILEFIFQVMQKNKNIKIELKESSGRVSIKHCTEGELVTFHLNMFLHYYNEKKILFLFDGFDEICPDYKNIVIKVLQVIKNDSKQNKMWIASRSYNNLLPDLVKYFGEPYKIAYFSKTEQINFLNRFWNKINLGNKNYTEYNIQEFLYFLSDIIPHLDNKLKVICYHFYRALLTKYKFNREADEVKLRVKNIEDVYKALHRSMLSLVKSEVNEFLGTPLLLYLSVMFFVTEILNFDKIRINGSPVYNIITMYESFIKTKLIKILFIDKCRINIHIPLIKQNCELELKDCMIIHKRLGAHAIFGSPIFAKYGLHLEEFHDMAPFNLDLDSGRREFISIINRIRCGKERTGLISHVTHDGLPIFIHKTFAEYFAAEYIFDILKSNKYKFDIKRLLLTVFISIMCNENVTDEHGEILYNIGVSAWFYENLKIEDEVRSIVNDIFKKKRLIAESVFGYSTAIKDTKLKQAYIRLNNSTLDDFEDQIFIQNNIQNYLTGRRELDDDLIKIMKPHLKKYFQNIHYKTNDYSAVQVLPPKFGHMEDFQL